MAPVPAPGPEGQPPDVDLGGGAADDGGPGVGGEGEGEGDADGDGPGPGGGDAGPGGPAGPSVSPGGACACDDDCIGDEAHAGLCIHGICGTRATSSDCAAGSRAECPDGQRCWNGTGDGVCYPDYVEGQCAGRRDDDDSCVTAGADCWAACGSLCGRPGEPPDEGADPNGACPSWECAGQGCEDIVAVPGSFDAGSADAAARGYYIESAAEHAFLRRDALMIVQWAICEMHARHPELPPLALLDMTTADGTTPGCEDGPDSCRHPAGTHHGTDIDAAYYQTDGTNDGVIICGDGSDDNANGTPGRFNDGYFCTTEDNIVDVEREVEFIQLVDSTGRLRVIGVDQTLADELEASGAVLGYGNSGGWAYHHHHVHVSLTQ